jgi:hypothetical protein
MRMGSFVKWFLVSVLLIAGALFAFVRISDAIDDYEQQIEQQLSTPPDTQPQSQPSRPWLRDPLIRT